MARIEDDKDAEPKGYAPDDTPDEIADFVISAGIGEKYQVMLKHHPEGGGKPGTLRCYSNYHPSINAIGEQWGPGEYELVFSWKTDGMNGRKEPTSKSYKVNLPEAAWAEVHEDYLRKKAEERNKAKQDKWKEEAERARILGQSGVATQPPSSELDALKKALEMAKSLGIPIGGQAQTTPKPTLAETLIGLAPVVTAAAPILVALIQKGSGNSENTLLNTVVTKMLDQKPPAESDMMKQTMGFMIGMMKQVMEVKEAMRPEEKEPFLERMIDKVANSLPMIMQFAAMSKEQREKDMMYKTAMNMAKNHPDMKTFQSDLGLQVDAVNRMDEVFGFEQTNTVLNVMGFTRPPETMENEEKFPSKKSAAAGQEGPAGQGGPSQDDLRKAPDAALGGTESEIPE